MNRLLRGAHTQRLPRAVRRWLAREFAAIAAANPELHQLDRRLAGLYLVPSTEEERWTS